MFRNVRLRIIVAIMAILLVVFASTLVAIYIVSYRDVLRKNIDMMTRYAQDYGMEPVDPRSPEPDPRTSMGRPQIHEEIYGLTSFYSVELSEDGIIRRTVNDDSSGLSDDELTNLALNAADKRKVSGSMDNMLYLVYKTAHGKLVVFMNNTIADESFNTLFRYALIFSGGMMIVLFFFSYYLSGRIIRPLKVAFDKQKQFVSDASHELKTPLSVMSANTELLSREIGDNRWLDGIRSENNRMAGLVNRLLSLAKSENSNTPFASVDLSRVVEGNVLPFESLAYEKKVKLELDVPEDIKVIGNEDQLGQVVSLLADNAIGHTYEGGTVRVVLKKTKGTAQMHVSNTGDEIPVDKRDRIFERFYRVDEARNRESNHYGLGLPIAKAIVSRHKGRISVDCADGWTTFTVTLPARG